MKIDVDPDVLRQIAAYCDEQEATMEATRAYLNEHGNISMGDFGLLLLITRPFYELCRGVTMTGFGLGAKLVKSRATAIHDYLDEQTRLESDNTNIWHQLGGILGQSGQGFSPGSGGGGNASHGAVPVSPPLPQFQDAEHRLAGDSGDPQILNPQPLPPVSDGLQHAQEDLNPQPLPPVSDAAANLQHVQEDLNPQPLPPGPPPEAVHVEALSDRQDVMDRVWQDRSAADPLGRSPEQLHSLFDARQPVEMPSDNQNLETLQLQSAMEHRSEAMNMISNVMKVVSDSQMSAINNIK